MTRRSRGLLSAAAVAALASSGLVIPGATAAPDEGRRSGTSYFGHVGSFFLQENLDPGEESEATSAEIMAFMPSGRELLYTDAFQARLGFVNVSDPSDPRPDGHLDLPGDPTSVAVVSGYALVAVVTNEDPDGDGPLNEYDAPSGELLVVRLSDRSIVRSIELAGQPDAVAVAPSKKYAAVVIENQRDEEENDGLLPQSPSGLLQVLTLGKHPAGWSLRDVGLTGLADRAPTDAEPEYVDINDHDMAVVSLQENNHLAVVDLRRAKVVKDFSAGTVDVRHVDITEEELGPDEAGLITLDGTLAARRREPDAVQWIDRDTFVTANEGDYVDEQGEEGGSRSFTLFNVDGSVEYESGSRFEHELVRAGHYPESRSENKGVEPEGLEVARIGGRTLIFVASERGNAVGVYEVVRGTARFLQLLPTGIGPEGLVVKNGLLAVSAEVDGLDDGFAARPFITFFRLADRSRPAYPMLRSGNDASGLPIPWVAQSGLAGDAHRKDVLWSVSDSYLAQAYLYRIDVGGRPAEITKALPVGDADGSYDLEGVATRPEGGFWLASEGNADTRVNQLLLVRGDGRVVRTVELPAELEAGATSNGFEGVAVTGSRSKGNETVWVAQQRSWADDQPGYTKIGRYDVAEDSWTFAAYTLDAPLTPGSTVGLSELTSLPGGRLAVIERDNQLGLEARIKRVYVVKPSKADFAPFGGALPVLHKTLAKDLLPQLDAASISVPDKLEGLGRTRDGRYFVVTDNDGVDEKYGETLFLRVVMPGSSH